MWRFLRSNQIANVTNSSSVSVRNWTAAAVAIIATSHNNWAGTGAGTPEYSSKAFSTDTNEKGSHGTASNWINGKVAFCQYPSDNDHNGNQKDEPKNNAKSDITFRQRRLSINNTKIMNRCEKKNDEQSKKDTKEPISRPRPNSDNIRIMYASEFEKEESLPVKVQAALPLNTHHDHEQQDASFCTSSVPFQSHQVGTFSCHGIEPHPFIVYDPPEPDTEITSFFRKMFGAEPATPNLRSRAKVVTMSKQKINQDRGHICMYSSGDSEPSVLFGTYDGHGEKGELLAEYTMNALYDKLHHHPSYHGIDEEQDMERAFHEIFSEIDDEIKDHHHLSPLNSGSTACVALLQGRKLWVANVGDSRAVLGRRRVKGARNPGNAAGAKSPPKEDEFPSKSSDSLNLDAIDLSRDQNVHDTSERERILNSGGYITVPQDPELPARIWLDEKCSQIGLAMSRSIGDHALKHVGVIAEPVVTDYDLGDNDEFFIIATDGVWEFVSSAEAVEIVGKCFQQGMSASGACKELIRISMGKWKDREGDYRDDITAIVVRLDDILNHPFEGSTK